MGTGWGTLGKMVGVSGQYIGMIEPAGDPVATASLCGLSPEQIQIALDIIKKVAHFVNTEDGNEALIREVASQQYPGKSSNEMNK